MPKDDHSDSEPEETDSDLPQQEEEEEGEESSPRKIGVRGREKMTEYEKQRINRIEENKARMRAMGLDKMASSFMGSASISKKKGKSENKGKRKVSLEDDDEYNPPQDDDDEELGSSSGEDDDEEEEFCASQKKSKGKSSTPRRKIPKLPEHSDFIDDDDALMEAIALSLQGSSGFLDVPKKTPFQSPDAKALSVKSTEIKHNVNKDDTGRRKRKNSFTSRVQMTEDELILHFFQFDEVGKGGINLRDVRRVATSLDFTWSDEEMKHMIDYFDSDGDGKLSLDDFTKIVERCNMRQGSGNAAHAAEAR